MNDVPDADRSAAAGPLPQAPTGGPAAEIAGTTSQANPEQVMDLLADHVPLALLMDLVTPDGPASAEILRDEGMPDDAWWETEPEAEPEPADGPAAPLGSDPASDEASSDDPHAVD